MYYIAAYRLLDYAMSSFSINPGCGGQKMCQDLKKNPDLKKYLDLKEQVIDLNIQTELCHHKASCLNA